MKVRAGVNAEEALDAQVEEGEGREFETRVSVLRVALLRSAHSEDSVEK